MPLVIFPTYKANQENPLNELQTKTKSNHEPIENTLHELPKIGKINASFISCQRRSKDKEFTILSKPIIKPINDKLKSNVEG